MHTYPNTQGTPVPKSNLTRRVRADRWTVARSQWFNENTDEFPPFVYLNRWRVVYNDHVEFFDTHAEALAYADRMARTVDVALPRTPLPLSLPGHKYDDPLVTVACDDDGEGVVITDHANGDVIGLYTYECRPLAIALLAYAAQAGL